MKAYRVTFVCGGCGSRLVKYCKPSLRMFVPAFVRCKCDSAAPFADGREVTLRENRIVARLLAR